MIFIINSKLLIKNEKQGTCIYAILLLYLYKLALLYAAIQSGWWVVEIPLLSRAFDALTIAVKCKKPVYITEDIFIGTQLQ